MKNTTVFVFLLSNGVNCIYNTIPQGYIKVYSYLNKSQNELFQDFTVYNPITSNIQLVKIIHDDDYINHFKCISKKSIYLIIPQIEIANKITKEHVIDIIKNYGIEACEEKQAKEKHISRLCFFGFICTVFGVGLIWFRNKEFKYPLIDVTPPRGYLGMQ
jgi:hypothetical protein